MQTSAARAATAARGALSPEPSRVSPRSQAAMVLRVVSGNFFEMYDFILFGIFAKDIANAYFPAHNAYLSQLLTFTTLWLGSAMRPLGALVLGGYIDRVGRRQGLVVTLGIMALGTAAIALLPGYATIGLLAPLGVLLGRLLQGFSAGVELGGVSVYLAEAAPAGHKGFFVSWQSGSQQVALIVASALGLGIREGLPPDLVAAWGWRIPFFIGCLIVPILFFVRRSLQETAEFAQQSHHPSFAQIRRNMAANLPILLAGVGWVVMTTVFFYFIATYTPTFGRGVLHLSTKQSLFVTLCVGVSNLCVLPCSAALSDRIGRAPILFCCSATAVLTAFPALFWLTEHPSLGHMLAVEIWLSLLYAGYNGAMVVALVEVMPKEVRTTGFSLAYSLATLLGTLTDLAATWLVHHYGKGSAGLWLSLSAICGFTATAWFTRSGLLRPAAETPPRSSV